MVAASNLQVVSEVVVKDTASAVADRISAAMDKLANSEADVQDQAVKSTRSLEQAARTMERYRAASDPAYAASQRLANIEKELTRASEILGDKTGEAAATMERLRAQANLSGNAFAQVSSAGRTSFGNLGNAIQQAGFQIGDFAVQVSSGSGVLRPLIQQGTQLISMFGPWGAVVGAAGAVVGALATSLLDTKDAAKDASKAVDTYAESLRQADEIAKKLRDDNQPTIDALQAERRYRLGVADAAIAEAQAKINAAKATLQQAIDNNNPAFAGFTGTDTSLQFTQEAAQKRLDQIAEIEKQVIAKQREIAAELRFGGDNLDPFAKQGQDFSSDYYRPPAPSNDNTHRRAAETKDISLQSSALSDLVDKMQEENDLLRSTGAQREALTKQREIETAISQAQAAAEKDYQAGLRDTEILTTQELQHVKDLAAAHYDVAAAQAKSTEAAKAQAKVEADLARQNEQAAHELTSFLDQGIDRIGSAVTQFTVQTGNAFDNMKGIALGVLSEIEQELIKLSIINPLKNALEGGNAPTLSSVGGGILDWLFGGSPAGTLSGGGPRGFATGGSVSGGVPILVGEQGPEIWTPSANGTIIPNNRLMAANSNAAPIINIIDQRQSGADIQTQQSTGPNGQKQIDILVRDSVNRQLGAGAFDKALKANFGSNRVASVRR
ncbi:MAG TPA: hypothetical protein VND94_01015 [Terriglobia bacterium]|nr:hypothetical protein [Terriglobia bacterium]